MERFENIISETEKSGDTKNEQGWNDTDDTARIQAEKLKDKRYKGLVDELIEAVKDNAHQKKIMTPLLGSWSNVLHEVGKSCTGSQSQHL